MNTRAVPVEPTNEMLEAAGRAYMETKYRPIYAALKAGIASAPPQPEPDEPCCEQYATCNRACTPRGKWIAEQARNATPQSDPVVTVDKQGVKFGKWCWVSHEKITGCEAALIPTKHKQYYEWFLANLRKEANATATLPHGVCRADDPNEEAIGDHAFPTTATKPSVADAIDPNARGVAPSVSDDRAGTSITSAVAPTWYFVGTDTNWAQCRQCGHKELVRIASTRTECPVCQLAERRVAQRRVAFWNSPDDPMRRISFSDRRQKAAVCKYAPASTLPLSAEQCEQAIWDVRVPEGGHWITRDCEAQQQAQRAIELKQQLAELKGSLDSNRLHTQHWMHRAEKAEALVAERDKNIADLRHDIARYVQHNSDLLAELAELKAGMFVAKKAGKA